MDRKNNRAGGTVGIAPTAAAAGSASTVMGVDDPQQDEAVVWKRTLAELQRLSEIIDTSDTIIAALDKVPEGEGQ